MQLQKYLLIALFLVAATSLLAANYIPITTDNTCLLLQVNDKNRLEQVYFGKKIKQLNELEAVPLKSFSAYSTFGTTHVFEAALRMTHADGNTSTELGYVSTKTDRKDTNILHTVISLKDEYYGLYVDLHYNAYQKEDIIEQWTEIRNGENKPVILNNFASADLSFYAKKYYVSQFYGDWSEEMNIAEQELTSGIKIIDTKLGVRSNQYTHPCFLLSLGNPAEESNGEVIGGTLAWPGNFQFCFEVDNDQKLRVLSGINPYASTYTLDKDKVFKTPALLYTYSNEGTGKITRNFHRWARKYGIKNGDKERSILLNNWEATYFDFDEPKLTQIIDDASKMGFELFLLDDGWFGNKYPRNGDTAGLGDWQTNTKKLPRGIPYLIEECKKRGLKFGIWVEPEMVNPKSELYEKHPDWVIAQPHRERTPQRNQLILDMSNPKVKEFVYNTIDEILQKNPGIDYVKWDCNRFVQNSGSSYLAADKQSHLWIDYSLALLEVMDKVSAKYPDVTFMACSGGGGRIDYGTMKHFDEYWISDNNDPLQRIFTQWGAQYFFPTIGLASHVSVSPNHISGRSTPLKYRFDIAMAGKLGMDLQPVQMTDEEKIFSKNAIETYKQIRKTVLHGDLYRILSPYKNNRTVFMYVNENKDEAIVFNFLVRKELKSDKQTIYLKGLDPNKTYTLKEINKVSPNWSRAAAYENKPFSGDYLMTVGLTFPIYNEYESVVLQLNSIK
ncbi:alpha-galactosidase [Dysgonomonas sp. ZJ709]|uniref:alpha-galactosidase n=1 Tax=Dysgonomonas sp. ZJ709 TaxID=2709797 RepID=UPI0013ECB528|nr:alpha-galactosidase [Dysgonomonas sp. ZJ709]